MKTKIKSMYNITTEGDKLFYCSLILIEILTYTFSFLVSGLAKKDIFNVLEQKPTTMGIYSLGMLIVLNVGIPLLINCVKQLNSGLVAKVEIRLKKNVKAHLLKTVLDDRLGKEKTWGHGELVSLFRNECEDLTAYLLEYYNQLPKIVLCVAILIVLICVNPIFFIISVLPTFGMVAFTNYLEKHLVVNREAARKSTSNITEYLENLFGNIEYFKLAANTDKLGSIFSDKCEERSRNEIKDRVLDKMLGILSENSASLVLGIVLLVAIPLYKKGGLTVGEFVMFEYYYAFLTALPDAVGKLVRRHKQSKVSVSRLKLLSEKEYEGTAAYVDEYLSVEIDYLEELIWVKARKGEVVLLNGGTECDRSMILQRLFQICSDFLGEVVCRYVPQQPILFNDSIRDNICLGEVYQENDFKKVIEKMDLIEDVKMFEDGVDKKVGRQGATVSGGQRKRIGIARAMYPNVDILFIDGLTEAVDKKTEQIMITNILEHPNEIIFLVSDTPNIEEKATIILNIGRNKRR